LPVVTVFGSSRPAAGHPEYETARQLGHELARAGFAVCTGGYGGTMEAVSRGASEAGGRVLAVTARVFRSKANPWVQEETVVESWRDRLFKLIELGDAYIALPGGTGTLAEIAVVWEMLNKGFLPQRRLALLGNFWRPMVEVVHAADGAGSLVRFAADPREACRMVMV
jgi:uncharacterized protein (TIGR00730 family)